MIKIKQVTDTINELLQDYSSEPSARRSFKGLSIEERQLERRKRIRDAGLELYGTRGFFVVKIRDVCAEAGLTERYFYESFKNAEALFHSIYAELVDRLQQKIIMSIAHAGPDEMSMAKAGIAAFLHTIQDDGRMARILFVDAIHVKETGGKTIREAVTRFDKMIKTFLTLNFGNAQITTIGSYMITGLNGYAAHIAVRWVASGFKASFEEVFEACMMVYRPLLENLQQKNSTLLNTVMTLPTESSIK